MWPARLCLILQLCLLAPSASASSIKGKLEDIVLSPLSILYTDIVSPIIFRQRPPDENGTETINRERILHDHTNENVGTFTAQQLIGRSGFLYEDHFVLSDDGYITNLIHIINPKANQSLLKQPPVFITHGAIIDPTAYVWASTISHWPEDYPRKPGQLPMTSSNRSLALMLSNHGYDVWLVGTRGANLMNQGHVRYKVFEPVGKTNMEKFIQFKSELKRMDNTFNFFDYTMDEIMKYEMPRQIEKVLELTGADKVIFLSFSFSTMIAFPMFATQLDVAKRIHQHIVLSPIINNKGATPQLKLMHKILPKVPFKTGVLFNDFFLTHPFPDFFNAWVTNKKVRYTFAKSSETWVAGSSGKYKTMLEAPVNWHLFISVGFKEAQHYCQQVVAGTHQRFDYGPVYNMFRYNSTKPPKHDISKSNVQKWMLVEANQDNLGTPQSGQQIYETVQPKPLRRLQIDGYNHLDLVAGWDNDVKVNLPILEFLDEYKLPPVKKMNDRQLGVRRKALSENLRLSKHVPGVHVAHADGLQSNWARR